MSSDVMLTRDVADTLEADFTWFGVSTQNGVVLVEFHVNIDEPALRNVRLSIWVSPAPPEVKLSFRYLAVDGDTPGGALPGEPVSFSMYPASTLSLSEMSDWRLP